ncbi:SIS domain-containing protein [Nanoarchaeota archaeon]
MNPQDKKYEIVREILEIPNIIKNFHTENLSKPLSSMRKTKKLFLVGEGSSRIFPAKNAINFSLSNKIPLTIYTEGCRQAAELNLKDYTLFGASNSGKTKEVLDLFKNRKSKSCFLLTENLETTIKEHCDSIYILNCGKERAVAASKSVIEEALFYQNLLSKYTTKNISKKELSNLSKKAKAVLTKEIDPGIIKKIAKAKIIYFSGRNNGVAEEAVLKANEIVRKKSIYLEGTYFVHGVEEVMKKNEVIILIDPFKQEEEKIKEVLVNGIGINVIAISSRQTIFPTIKIPKMNNFDTYLQLLACWNLLIESGKKLKINLDKPKRARKIGNEISN